MSKIKLVATATLVEFPEVTKSAPLTIAQELKGFWLDMEDNQLVQTNQLNKNVYFGEKVKIKIIATGVPDEEEIEVTIKEKLENEELQTFTLIVYNEEAISEPIYLKPQWYYEDIEEYDYTNYLTKIDVDKTATFIFDAKLTDGTIDTKDLPKDDIHKLKPVTYRRNYEELVGLFNTNDSGEKDKESNYENKFIDENPTIKGIVDKFIETITEEDSATPLEDEVEEKAKALWDAAVAQKYVQGGNLDDRPLYWARNKMQVWLKRHPSFKDEYNENSIVTGSTLAQIIQQFEILSRNYMGVDFSGMDVNLTDPNDPALVNLTQLPKVLITGFDPFFLNEFDHPWKSSFNIRQSNPSGCVALALANNLELGANIQTMMFPVRYTDFDNDTTPKTGQGKGVVEEYIGRLIDDVDMIITVSQALPRDYNIDVFATATRGGAYDNMSFTRKKGDKSVSDSSPETIVTTLNSKFTQPPSKAIYHGKYFETRSDYENDTNEKDSTITTIPNRKIYAGPGGNYLSNEIFYRVAMMRPGSNPTLQTGHFHIAKLQDHRTKEDYNNAEMKASMITIEKAIKNGIKGL